MPDFRAILGLMKYAPTVLQVIQGMRRGQKDDEVQHVADDMQHELENIKKQLNNQITTLEEANAQLRTRVRELESSISTLKMLVYNSLGLGGLAVIIAVLIAAFAR